MIDLTNMCPDPEPQDETPLPPDHPFADECKALFADHAEAGGWHYGKSMVTRSNKWGLVWRADTYTPDGQRSTRLIVHRPEDAKEIFGTVILPRPDRPLD